MKKNVIAGTILTATLMAMSPVQVMAAEATSSASECELAIDGAFPIKQLEDLGEVQPLEGTVPQDVRVIDGKPAYSTLSMGQSTGSVVYFTTSLMNRAGELDANDTAALRSHPLFRFLEDFGIQEMALLGPDLKAKNPFLDGSSVSVDSPSQDKVEATSKSLAELAGKMEGLIGADQKGIIEKLGELNFSGAADDVERKLRMVASQYTFTKKMFAPFLTDRKFLQDMQDLLAGNLMQFEDDVIFMDEIKARFNKAKTALGALATQGDQIYAMEAQVLAQIQDDYTKQVMKAAFTRFKRRVTDLRSGVAFAETYINVWNTVQLNHYELIGGINRALHYSVGLIGAQAMLNRAIERQKATQAVIQDVDNYTFELNKRMMEQMGKNVEDRQRFELESIENNLEMLGEMAVANIAIANSMNRHQEVLRERLTQADGELDDLARRAREAREGVAADSAEEDGVFQDQD